MFWYDYGRLCSIWLYTASGPSIISSCMKIVRPFLKSNQDPYSWYHTIQVAYSSNRELLNTGTGNWIRRLRVACSLKCRHFCCSTCYFITRLNSWSWQLDRSCFSCYLHTTWLSCCLCTTPCICCVCYYLELWAIHYAQWCTVARTLKINWVFSY